MSILGVWASGEQTWGLLATFPLVNLKTHQGFWVLGNICKSPCYTALWSDSLAAAEGVDTCISVTSEDPSDDPGTRALCSPWELSQPYPLHHWSFCTSPRVRVMTLSICRVTRAALFPRIKSSDLNTWLWPHLYRLSHLHKNSHPQLKILIIQFHHVPCISLCKKPHCQFPYIFPVGLRENSRFHLDSGLICWSLLRNYLYLSLTYTFWNLLGLMVSVRFRVSWSQNESESRINH